MFPRSPDRTGRAGAHQNAPARSARCGPTTPRPCPPRRSARWALAAERAEHRAERQVEIEEHRPLLDVELDVGRGALELSPALPRALEVDSMPAQCLGKRDAVLVLQAACLVEVQMSRARRGTEQ